MDPEAHITDIRERHGCVIVNGVVNKGQGWLKASATVMKADISHMSSDEFRAWITPRLQHYTEEIQWMEQAFA